MHYLFFVPIFYVMVLFVAIFSGLAQATPLMNTDDATIVDIGQCQLETAQRYERHQNQALWMTPACHLLGVELSVPVTQEENSALYGFEVKHPFFLNDQWGLAASVSYQPRQAGDAKDWHVNVPLSVFDFYAVQLDANIGIHHFNDQRRMTWAVASSVPFKESNRISFELYKIDSGRTQSQIIFQYSVLPNRLALFSSYGRELQSNDQSWFGIGLSWNGAVL